MTPRTFKEALALTESFKRIAPAFLMAGEAMAPIAGAFADLPSSEPFRLAFRTIWQAGLGLAFRRIDVAAKGLEADAQKLGALGWTVPLWGTPALIRQLLTSVSEAKVDALMVKTYRARSHTQFRQLLNGLLDRKVLSRWRPLLVQCRFAYYRDKHLIAVPALLTVVEGLLADTAGAISKSINPRQVAQAKHSQAKQYRAALWASVFSFVSIVFQSRSFAAPPPSLINRHWILHGRDQAKWNRADSLRLFQAVDTLSWLAS